MPHASLWDSALRQQIYLSDAEFVERMQRLAQPRNSTDHDISRVQRPKARTLAQWLASWRIEKRRYTERKRKVALSMSAIAKDLGLSVSRVSRLIARAQEAKGKRQKGKGKA